MSMKELIAEQCQEKLYVASERILELERREALLTANVIACERRRSYRAPKPPMSMNDAEVHAWSLDEMAIDLAMVNTYAALTEAGFPWRQPVCPECGETFSYDCWRCVGAENPRS